MPRGTGYGPLAQALRQPSFNGPTGMAGPSRLQVGPKNIGFNNMGNKQPQLQQRAFGHPLKDSYKGPVGFLEKVGGLHLAALEDFDNGINRSQTITAT